MSIESREDIRATVSKLFDIIEQHELPFPFTFTFDEELGRVDVSWMLHEDQEASRKVIGAFPGEWVQARSSSAREPVFDYKADLYDITVWAHPQAVVLKVVL